MVGNKYSIEIGAKINESEWQKVTQRVHGLAAAKYPKLDLIDAEDAMRQLTLIKDEAGKVAKYLGTLDIKGSSSVLNFEFDPSQNVAKFEKSMADIVSVISSVKDVSGTKVSELLSDKSVVGVHSAIDIVIDKYKQLRKILSGESLKQVMEDSFDFSQLGFSFDDLTKGKYKSLYSKTYRHFNFKREDLDTLSEASTKEDIQRIKTANALLEEQYRSISKIKQVAADGSVLGFNNDVLSKLVADMKAAQLEIKKMSAISHLEMPEDGDDADAKPVEIIDRISVDAVDKTTGNIVTKIFTLNESGDRFEETASRVVSDFEKARREAEQLSKVLDANAAYAKKQEAALRAAESAAFKQSKPILSGSQRADQLNSISDSIGAAIKQALADAEMAGEAIPKRVRAAIETTISDYKTLTKQFRDEQYSADKLATKGIDQLRGSKSAELDSIISRYTSSGVNFGKVAEKIKEVNALISTMDAKNVQKVNVALSELRALATQTKNSTDTTIKAMVSSTARLPKQIGDLQKKYVELGYSQKTAQTLTADLRKQYAAFMQETNTPKRLGLFKKLIADIDQARTATKSLKTDMRSLEKAKTQSYGEYLERGVKQQIRLKPSLTKGENLYRQAGEVMKNFYGLTDEDILGGSFEKLTGPLGTKLKEALDIYRRVSAEINNISLSKLRKDTELAARKTSELKTAAEQVKEIISSINSSGFKVLGSDVFRQDFADLQASIHKFQADYGDVLTGDFAARFNSIEQSSANIVNAEQLHTASDAMKTLKKEVAATDLGKIAELRRGFLDLGIDPKQVSGKLQSVTDAYQAFVNETDADKKSKLFDSLTEQIALAEKKLDGLKASVKEFKKLQEDIADLGYGAYLDKGADGELTEKKSLTSGQNLVANAASALKNYYGLLDSDILDGNFDKVSGELGINLVTALGHYRELSTKIASLSMDDLLKDTDLAKRKSEELKTAIDRVKVALNAVNGAGFDPIDSDDYRQTVADLQKSINDFQSNYAKAFSFGNEGKGFSARYKQIVSDFANAKNAEDIHRVADALKTLIKEADASDMKGATLFGKISDNISKYGGWMMVTQTVSAAIRTLKKMIDVVYELDAAMTELKKVTNESDVAYERFLRGAAERAKTLGATLHEVVNATADFARLGYNLQEASELADVALIYNNVGDGLEDINEASASIVSTMQAFQVAPEEAIRIIDKFNLVGNRFAITSGGLGQALQNGASALNAANNTLDESIALITAANTVVQDPESVGTAMKTLSMRLRGAEAELEAAGLDTDGLASSVSELRGELISLTGVDIMLDADNFKSTYQIMLEMSKVWDEMTDVSKAAALELMAGKRMGNVVSALLSSGELLEGVKDTSENSAGSAMKENEVYLESLQGHVDRMNSSFQVLSSNLANSEMLKFLMDVLTGVINGVNGLTEAVGGANTVMIAAASALFIYAAAQKSQAVNQQSLAASTAFLNAVKNKEVGVTLKAAAANMKHAISAKAAAAGQRLLSTAMSVGPYILLAAAVAGAVAAVDYFVVTYKEQLEILDEAKAEYKETTDELKSVENELEETAKRMEELKALGALSIVEKDELAKLEAENEALRVQKDYLEAIAKLQNKEVVDATLDTLEKFADKSLPGRGDKDDPYGFDGYDAEVRRLSQTQDKLNRLNKDYNDAITRGDQSRIAEIFAEIQLEEKAFEEQAGNLQSIKEQLDGIFADIDYGMSDATDTALDEFDEFTRMLTAVLTGVSLPSQALNEFMDAEEHQKIIGTIIQLYNNGKIDLGSIEDSADVANTLIALSGHLNDFELNHLFELFAAAQAEGLELIDILLEIERMGSPVTEVNGAAEAYKNYQTAAAKHTAGDLDDDDYLSELEAQLKHIDEMIDKDAEHANHWRMVKEYIIAARSELEAYADAMLEATKDIESSVTGVNDAFAEQIEHGKLSAETILSVVEAGYAAALEIDDETKAVKVNAEAYKQLAGAKIQEQIVSLTISRDALAQKLRDEEFAVTRLTGEVNELTAARLAEIAVEWAAVDAYDGQIAALQNLFSNLDAITGGIYGGSSGGGSSDPWKDAAEKEFAALKHLYNMDLITIQEYHDRYNALNQKYYAGREKYIDDYRSNLEELKSLMEEIYELEIEDIQAKIDFNYSRDWAAPEQIQDSVTGIMRDATEVDYVQDMMQLLEQYYNEGKISFKYYTDKKKELSKQFYEAEKSLIERTKDKWTGAIDDEIDALNERKDALSKQLALYDKAYSAVIDRIKQEKDELQEQRDEEQEYWDERINALEEENEETTKQIELQEKQLALKKAQQTYVKIYREGQGYVWEQDQTAIQNAQAELDSYKREQQYENEREELERLRDEALEDIDDMIEAWDDYLQKWEEAAAAYENQQNILAALEIFGENWEQGVMAQNLKMVSQFAEEYVNIQSSIADIENSVELLEKHKDAVATAAEEQIEHLNSLKKTWEDALNMKPAFDIFTVALDELASSELANYNLRITALTDFAARYNSIVNDIVGDTNKALASVDQMSDGAIDIASGSIASSSSDTVPMWNGIRVNDKQLAEWKADGWEYLGENTWANTRTGEVTDGGYNKKKAQGYAVGTTGISNDQLALVGEKGPELRVLGKGTGIIPADITKRLWEFGLDPVSFMRNTVSKIIGKPSAPVSAVNQDNSVTISIGDIILQNVSNSDGLAKAIVQKLPAAIIQKIKGR